MIEIFPPAPAAARLFHLPPGVDFGAALIAGLKARLEGQPPEALARVEIFVNTERARRRLVGLFQNGPSCLLPRIRTLAELPFLAITTGAELPTTLDPLERQLTLARLIRALIAAEPDLAPPAAAFELAGSLQDLFAEMQEEAVDFEALASIDPGDLSGHWQRSLRFLRLLQEVATPDQAEPAGLARRAADWLAAHWSEGHGPSHPVLVAGSTASRGATRIFMEAVAKLPQGALVLPGFDASLSPQDWAGLAQTSAEGHPQARFARLGAGLGVSLSDCPAWHDTAPPAPARNALVSLALAPAPVTDRWLSDGPALIPQLGAATQGITLLEADSPRSEALAIAVALREALADGETAALITPDRTLARRVIAEMDRWGVDPDDSAGRPLALAPPGGFLMQIAAFMAAPLAPVDLLALLKHPLTASAPEARAAHLRLTRLLETRELAGGPPFVDWSRIVRWATAADAEGWGAWLQAVLDPLRDLGAQDVSAWVARHIETAEALSAGRDGAAAGALWEKDAGQAAQKAMSDLLAAATSAGGQIGATEYRAIVRSHLMGIEVPDAPFQPHPDVAIWGTLEARSQTADLVVLAGLNQGVWPADPGADPWLNRAMRTGIGLTSPERRIGLAAHDFQQAVAAPRVVIARALRDAEAPTVASRWVMRLGNLVEGLGEEGAAALAQMRARGDRLTTLARALGRVDKTPRAPRPNPAPPVARRPDRLSVTNIETLIRDPYAIYAQKVLGLRPLPPLGRVADAMERGTVLHRIMERFVHAIRDGLPETPEEIEALLTGVAEPELAAVPWPTARRLWRAKIAAVAPWLAETEIDRWAAGRPVATEVKGYFDLAAVPRPFRLTARADRIDLTESGEALIYDYKSGAPPTKPAADAFAKQLYLEAVMIERGVMEGLDPTPVAGASYIGFSRKIQPLSFDEETIPRHLEELQSLITAYLSPETGFLARSRPQRLSYASDYDHLSRYGEWQDGDDAPVVPVGDAT